MRKAIGGTDTQANADAARKWALGLTDVSLGQLDAWQLLAKARELGVDLDVVTKAVTARRTTGLDAAVAQPLPERQSAPIVGADLYGTEGVGPAAQALIAKLPEAEDDFSARQHLLSDLRSAAELFRAAGQPAPADAVFSEALDREAARLRTRDDAAATLWGMAKLGSLTPAGVGSFVTELTHTAASLAKKKDDMSAGWFLLGVWREAAKQQAKGARPELAALSSALYQALGKHGDAGQYRTTVREVIRTEGAAVFGAISDGADAAATRKAINDAAALVVREIGTALLKAGLASGTVKVGGNEENLGDTDTVKLMRTWISDQSPQWKEVTTSLSARGFEVSSAKAGSDMGGAFFKLTVRATGKSAARLVVLPKDAPLAKEQLAVRRLLAQELIGRGESDGKVVVEKAEYRDELNVDPSRSDVLAVYALLERPDAWKIVKAALAKSGITVSSSKSGIDMGGKQIELRATVAA